MPTDCSEQLTFWDLGPQQVTVDFDGGHVVTDAGLLPMRELDKELGVLAELAQRLPDPRAEVRHPHARSHPDPAGLPDPGRLPRWQRRQPLRHDPLFQTLADVVPRRRPALGQRLHPGPLQARLHPPRKPTCPWRNGRCWARSTPPKRTASRSSTTICPNCSSAPRRQPPAVRHHRLRPVR